MTYARSVAVIHNMAHQGRGPMAELAPLEIPQQYENLVSAPTLQCRCPPAVIASGVRLQRAQCAAACL